MFKEWKEELTTIERELLNFIYSYSKDNSTWPQNSEIRVALKDTFSYEANLNSIGTQERGLNGYFLNFYERSNSYSKEGYTSLTPLGIALCDNSKEDIELFLKIIRFFSRKYIDNPRNSNEVIYIKDFPTEYFISEDEIKNFCALFLRETPQLFHFTGTACNFVLDYKIIDLSTVRTIEEYYNRIYNKTVPPRFNKDLQNSNRSVINSEGINNWVNSGKISTNIDVNVGVNKEIYLDIETVPDDFYRKLIDLINECYSKEIYVAVPVFYRKLLESLIVDILKRKYGKTDISIFFDKKNRKYYGFNKLLKSFEEKLSDFHIFMPSLNKQFIRDISKYREKGNTNVHVLEIDMNENKTELDKNKVNLNHNINLLIRLYIQLP